MPKPSMIEVMQLVPEIISKLDGIKIKQPEIIFDESLKAWYVSIYAEDDQTVEKVKSLLPTLLGFLASDHPEQKTESENS